MQLLGGGESVDVPWEYCKGQVDSSATTEPLRWPSARFTSVWGLPEEEAQGRSFFRLLRASKGDCEKGVRKAPLHKAGASTGTSGAEGLPVTTSRLIFLGTRLYQSVSEGLP